MTVIETITLTRLRIPLSEPYHLSHTTVRALDTVIVKVELDDNRIGFGEVTPLRGYSTETIDKIWPSLTAVAPEISGESIDTARRVAAELPGGRFAQSAIDVALETAERDSLPPVTAPLTGILSTENPVDRSLATLDRQLEAGFETIKVKIGFDSTRDAQRLERIAAATPSSVALRVDANQGYSLAEARRFLDAAPTDRLQHVEQPLSVGALDDHATLNRAYDVTIMLDEEITDRSDVVAASKAGAAGAVKFKLMKSGGWAATEACIQTARDRGLAVVLGNGVQSDLGCLHEATLWAETDLRLAGEFNGWRKQERSLLTALSFDDGALSWAGDAPDPDEAALRLYRVDERQISA